MRLYFLQEYHRHGMPARVGIVKFFLDQINDNLKTYNPKQIEKERKFDLNNKQKLGLLQIGTISHLMLLIEDIATLFTAFKNNEWNYYEYLDRKGDEDLGVIISNFYLHIDELKDEDIRLVLGYANPRKLNYNESDKDFLSSIIQKNIHSMRYFLVKASVFWRSHIGVFRRYKHAGFPILLGLPIPTNDSVLKKKFDFTSLALTSKENIGEEVTVIPFSQKALESYQTFLEEMFIVLYSVLENNLIKIERKLDGSIPNPIELFTKRLTKKELKRLTKIHSEFLKSTAPEKLEYKAHGEPQGVYPTWYVYLDTYVKSSIDLAIEKNPKTT